MAQKDVEEWREDLPDIRLAAHKAEINLIAQKSEVNLMKEFNEMSLLQLGDIDAPMDNIDMNLEIEE